MYSLYRFTSFFWLPEAVTPFHTSDPHTCCSSCLKSRSHLSRINCYSFFKTQLKCFLFGGAVSLLPTS